MRGQVKHTPTVLLALTGLLILALSACVRPAPGAENQPEATATTDVFFNPTLPAATLPAGGVVPGVASPTPLPLAPPAEASPTPLPVAPEPTQPPPAPTAAPTGEQIHTVAAGENLFRIGLRYGFTAAELAAYNNIPNVDRIYVGQQIKIPPKP